MLTFGPDHTRAVSALAFKQGLIHTDVKALATDVGELSSKLDSEANGLTNQLSLCISKVNSMQDDLQQVKSNQWKSFEANAFATKIESMLQGLTDGVSALATKTDVGGLSRDLSFKQSLIHSDVNTLATDVSTIKATVSALPTVAMVNGVQGTVEAIGADVTRVTDGVSALATKTDVGGLSSKQSLIHADVNTLATGVEALVENISLVGVALSYTWERGPGNPQDPGAPWGNGPWESMHVEGSNGSKLSVPIPSKWVGSEHRLQLDKRYTWTIRATGIVRENHGLRVQQKRWPSYTIDLDAIDLDSDTLTLAVGWGTGPLG